MYCGRDRRLEGQDNVKERNDAVGARGPGMWKEMGQDRIRVVQLRGYVQGATDARWMCRLTGEEDHSSGNFILAVIVVIFAFCILSPSRPPINAAAPMRL